jgi:hypothetical protein
VIRSSLPSTRRLRKAAGSSPGTRATSLSMSYVPPHSGYPTPGPMSTCNHIWTTIIVKQHDSEKPEIRQRLTIFGSASILSQHAHWKMPEDPSRESSKSRRSWAICNINFSVRRISSCLCLRDPVGGVAYRVVAVHRGVGTDSRSTGVAGVPWRRASGGWAWGVLRLFC